MRTRARSAGTAARRESCCAVWRKPRRGGLERAGAVPGTLPRAGGRLPRSRAWSGVATPRPVDGARGERRGTGLREVIIATNPSMEGEVTATYLQQLLSRRRSGDPHRGGIPVGGDLEYADGSTIAQALLARRDMAESDRPEGRNGGCGELVVLRERLQADPAALAGVSPGLERPAARCSLTAPASCRHVGDPPQFDATALRLASPPPTSAPTTSLPK